MVTRKLAKDLTVYDTVVRDGKIRQIIRFGLSTKITVQFEDYHWQEYKADRLLIVKDSELKGQ